MYAAMTLPTNINTVLQFGFAEVLFEIGAPMHFFGNKVVISKARLSVTTRAFSYFICHIVTFICSLGQPLLKPTVCILYSTVTERHRYYQRALLSRKTLCTL